jgi:two-component system sensor histidine kinase/response regulator
MSQELTALREQFGRFLVFLLWGHVPLMVIVAIANDRPWYGAAGASVCLAGIYHFSLLRNGIAPVTRYLSAIALMGEPALLVFLLRGHPWQMDMHMYFFAMLALTIAWCDRRPILLAATAVALHHLLLLYVLVYAVFPGGGNLPRVLLHAGIVAFQTTVLVWLSNMIESTFNRIHVIGEELIGANSALKQRTLEAEKANSAKSMFLANMSHEIRTPLNAVLGFCHLLQRTELNVKQEDYVTKISSAGTSLLRLINDILDFSKNEAGKLTLEANPFSPHALIEQQLQLVLMDARAKGVQLKVENDEALPATMIGDELRVGQVILNLVSNAVKFTEHGSVTVRTRLHDQTDSHVTMAVEVVDTGIGMSKEQQEKLFSSFTQADSSMTRRFGGTGLGLAISRQIVGLMGGEITVESRPWEGTTFRFTLQLGKHTAAPAPRLLPSPAVGRLRAIAVDDNPASRQIVEEVFADWSMQIEVVATAAELIARLESASAGGRPYELALVDWKMPGMDGLEAVRNISANPAIPVKPKMVVVTAYGSDEFTAQAERHGVAAYLTKPLDPRALLQTLNELFASATAVPEPAPLTAAPAETGAVPQVAAQFRGQRVLLVEDNQINREIATELLTDAGLLVDTTENGLEAFEQVRRMGDEYAAVLMDLQMPVMDGLESTRLIRQNWPSERLPIIAMTAHAYEEERQRCMDAGMDDHISKPVDPAVLVRTLDRWLRAPKAPVAPAPMVAAAARSDELPQELLPFDIPRALERVNGKRPLLRRLIIDFADTQCDAGPEIRRLLASGHVQDARRVSHTLKGLAGTLELPALQVAAARLEQAIMTGAGPGTDTLIAQVEAELAPAIAAAAGLRAKPAEPTPASAPLRPQAPMADVVALRDKLQGQLAKRSLGARSSFAELAAAMGLTAATVAQHPLHKALERLDYDAAVVALAALDLGDVEAGQRA